MGFNEGARRQRFRLDSVSISVDQDMASRVNHVIRDH